MPVTLWTAWRWRCVAVLCALAWVPRARAQACPLPEADVRSIYQRLLQQIDQIPIFDNHAHPAFPDDPDVDAMVAPPGSSALRLRDTNPELVSAAKALFDYPYTDMAPKHASWLAQKKAEWRKASGIDYFSRILDRAGIETSLANRVAMAGYLDPARFRWVFFVDSFLFPFDNRQFAARNPDLAIYIPLQEKVLHRYLRQVELEQIPADLPGYESFIRRILEENQKRGGVAIKFEAAYFRSLRFEEASQERAVAIYKKHRAGGVPSAEEYRIFQDYIFRMLLVEAGRLHLSVHLHSAVGVGDYFSLQQGNVLNLENVLRDPHYANVTFVLIHGGYPFEREAIWLAAAKNVYLDSSLMELYLYPAEFKRSLKQWLEVFPEKIMFGSDAFPFNDALGAEETYWLAVRSARTALAAALAEMVSTGDVSESKALEFAHSYLHDTAARLYAQQ